MILVTGATGFLGSELAMQLVQAANNIRCIKRASSVIPPILIPFQQQIQWVDADMLDIFALEDAFEDVTQVYHCAAWVSLKQADKQPMIRANVTGTANVVNLCNERDIRLVHVSSIAAIGQALPGLLITENTHLEEATENDGYAISKLESEMEVWRGIAEGLNAVIVNPSLIIGPNAGTDGSGQLFETVRKGLKFYTLGSSGFVDVQDVAKSMIALMNSKIHSERYIINAENISYKAITTSIATGFGIKPPATLAKPWMMGLAWRGAALAGALTGKAPSIDKVAAQTASQTRNYDNSKIKKAIGIEFKPVAESVREICAVLSVSAKTATYSSDFVLIKDDNTAFINDLINTFPQIKEEVLDDDWVDLIHLQVGCFTRFTQEAIDSNNSLVALKCFQFVEENLTQVNPKVENALVISWIFHLSFNKNESLYDQFPLSLKEIRIKLEEHYNHDFNTEKGKKITADSEKKLNEFLKGLNKDSD